MVGSKHAKEPRLCHDVDVVAGQELHNTHQCHGLSHQMQPCGAKALVASQKQWDVQSPPCPTHAPPRDDAARWMEARYAFNSARVKSRGSSDTIEASVCTGTGLGGAMGTESVELWRECTELALEAVRDFDLRRDLGLSGSSGTPVMACVGGGGAAVREKRMTE